LQPYELIALRLPLPDIQKLPPATGNGSPVLLFSNPVVWFWSLNDKD